MSETYLASSMSLYYLLRLHWFNLEALNLFNAITLIFFRKFIAIYVVSLDDKKNSVKTKVWRIIYVCNIFNLIYTYYKTYGCNKKKKKHEILSIPRMLVRDLPAGHGSQFERRRFRLHETKTV